MELDFHIISVRQNLPLAQVVQPNGNSYLATPTFPNTDWLAIRNFLEASNAIANRNEVTHTLKIDNGENLHPVMMYSGFANMESHRLDPDGVPWCRFTNWDAWTAECYEFAAQICQAGFVKLSHFQTRQCAWLGPLPEGIPLDDEIAS